MDAADLVMGEIDGITWYEIPIEASGSNADAGGRRTMIAIASAPPNDWTANNLFTKPASCRHREPGPFIPFDAGKVFPGRIVGCRPGAFEDEWITGWMHRHADVPETLDVRFETYGSGGPGSRFTVIARTARRGRPTIVRRQLDPGIPAREAFARELPWLLRNCPRPDDGAVVCGKHVARILAAATPAAVRRIRAWLDRPLNRNETREGLTLGGFFLPGTGVERIMLTINGASMMRAEIRLEGGHVVKEDDSGIEIEIVQQLPDTIVNGLKGATLSRLIDVEWGAPVVIRHPRGWDPKRRITSLRGISDGVPLGLPEAVGDPDEDAAARSLAELAGHGEEEWPDVSEVSAAAIPALRGLSPTDLLALVEMMRVEGTVDLAIFGRPGWRLRMRGTGIVVDASPDVAYADFLREVMGLEVPE